MMNDSESPGCLIVSTILTIVFLFFIYYFLAHFEARSYRKFCDRDVTAWDAMFLDLRIDECGRQKELNK